MLWIYIFYRTDKHLHVPGREREEEMSVPATSTTESPLCKQTSIWNSFTLSDFLSIVNPKSLPTVKSKLCFLPELLACRDTHFDSSTEDTALSLREKVIRLPSESLNSALLVFFPQQMFYKVVYQWRFVTYFDTNNRPGWVPERLVCFTIWPTYTTEVLFEGKPIVAAIHWFSFIVSMLIRVILVYILPLLLYFVF